MRDRGSARVSSVRRVNCLRSPITTIGASADRADSRNGYYADRNVNSPRMSRSALETRVTAHVRGGYKGGERLLGGDSRRDSLRGEDTSPANWAQPIRVSQEPILGLWVRATPARMRNLQCQSTSRASCRHCHCSIHSQTVAPTGQSSPRVSG